MIRTRQEACSALGLAATASSTQIKAAYKDLVKKCHPDVTGSDDATLYNRITEAYQFLMNENSGKVFAGSRVMGRQNSKHTASNADYKAFQKKAQKQKQRRAEEFEAKQKELTAKLEKQEADYQRAMKAIDAVLAARALEAMIRANDINSKEKDNE